MDKFHRIVFGGGDLFQGGSVDYRINALKGSFETGSIADVADEVAQGWILLIAEFLSHFVLLDFVSAKNDKPLNIWESPQAFSCDSLPKAACSASD